MAKRGDKKPLPAGKTQRREGESAAPRPASAKEFAIHEPIGRQLRAIFDEITTQPVPDKFLKLLEELERKRAKD